jgi:hypothetical protein
MMHSILIIGGTEKRRKRIALDSRGRAQGWQTALRREQGEELPPRARKPASRFDSVIIEPEEDKQLITIAQIRNLQRRLALKPYHKKQQSGIILEAQRMTIEAQNALLKTLEEPPAHSVLILTAPSTKNLLPTIVSRCQINRLKDEIDLELDNKNYQEAAAEFWQILKWGRGERLEWAERNKKIFSDQSSILNLLDIWTAALREVLLTTALSGNGSRFLVHELLLTIEQIIDTKKLLESSNVSPRLAIEVLLLNLPVLKTPAADSSEQ